MEARKWNFDFHSEPSGSASQLWIDQLGKFLMLINKLLQTQKGFKLTIDQPASILLGKNHKS
jgi:hypothetical protein